MPNKRPLLLVSTTLACAITLLGLSVLYGWYSHTESLIQIHSTFVPMQYNTALGFFLCGLTLLLIRYKQFKGAAIASFFIALIGLGTLFQYLSGASIGIDQLFMEHYITVLSSHPGRMAPNTALCFLISGMAILLSSSASNTSTAKNILGISGSMVLGLGTIALFGYIAEIETVYGWGRLTRMAMHTSAGFIVLGSALILLGWPGDTDKTGLPAWAPFSSGLFSSALILSLWQALHPDQNIDAAAFGHDVLLLLGLILSGGIMWLVRLSMKLQDRAFEAENNANFLLEAKNRAKVNHEILEKLSTLQQEFIGEANTSESFAKLLDHILDVTESEYGFIGEVIDDDTPYLKTHAITDIAWNEETKKM